MKANGLPRNMVAFGSICMADQCSFCGATPKRTYPRMCVHVGIDTKQMEIRVVQEDRKNADRETLKDWRVMFVICLKCAQRLGDKLDQAIEQAHGQREKFFAKEVNCAR